MTLAKAVDCCHSQYDAFEQIYCVVREAQVYSSTKKQVKYYMEKMKWFSSEKKVSGTSPYKFAFEELMCVVQLAKDNNDKIRWMHVQVMYKRFESFALRKELSQIQEELEMAEKAEKYIISVEKIEQLRVFLQKWNNAKLS
jgi:lysyl-tRNA synthetase class I